MMNPDVAAAKFVLQKNATERDVKRTAEEIDEEIVNTNNRSSDEYKIANGPKFL
jgi:hypothetical protein